MTNYLIKPLTGNLEMFAATIEPISSEPGTPTHPIVIPDPPVPPDPPIDVPPGPVDPGYSPPWAQVPPGTQPPPLPPGRWIYVPDLGWVWKPAGGGGKPSPLP